MELSGMDLAVEAAGGQKALSELVGSHQSNISKYRIARFAPPRLAARIARATGVPVIALLDPIIHKTLQEQQGQGGEK